jgi:hypothetical protein
MLLRILPRHKALPNQAGFIRRGLAFTVDVIIISVFSLFIYLIFNELKAHGSGEPGIITQMSQALKEGSSFSIRLKEDRDAERHMKHSLLKILKGKIPPEEYELAEKLSSEKIYHAYEEEFIAAGHKHTFIYADETFNILKEYVVSLIYFVFFFRFGGRTPGKRIFRLKAVDLEGKSRLGWYQCFERAHGYVCSGLFASLGFWQVLWNKKGLTMHDKIAGTTVVKLLKKKRSKKKKKAKKKKNS